MKIYFNYPALISAICIFSPSASYAETKSFPQYEKCMDSIDLGAFKNTQWASCAKQELKRQDVILNTEYNKLRKNLSSEQNELLTKGQRSWLKYREDWCRFEEVSPAAPSGIANYNFCLLETTGKQIEAIKSFQ